MNSTNPDKLQHPNPYSKKLPQQDELEKDRQRFLEEIRVKLSSAVVENDIGQCCIWVINLHKYIILYGLAFTREEHIFYIKLLYGLLTTKNIDPISLDKFAKVLFALIKKKFLVPRSQLILDWVPLYEMFHMWDDSSVSMRGLLKSQTGFKEQLKSIIKVCRGYFSDDSTAEMLERLKPMLCPADRSMSTAIRYLQLFLPTTKDIPPEKSWKLWLGMLTSFWQTWGNSPSWEVDILRLYSRLASHRVGQVDWDPHMTELFTRFMSSFNLPVTFGGSGLQLKHGISGNNACPGVITKWIVSTLGPDSSTQSHLSIMLRAIRSYYHPANLNNSSDQLHVFISNLCTHFIDRLHLERYNTKWVTKIPQEKRLRDSDITEFVDCVAPIAWLVLYNNFEEEARSVFSSLALISPGTIIPRLLDTLSTAADILTEPHRFHVCVQAVSAIAGPLARNFPGRAVQLLHSLLPAIDVNDIWKSTDIFICMSDLLEMIPVSSSLPAIEHHVDDVPITQSFEDFVAEFFSKCFTMIENSRRENFRSDGTTTEDYLNDEEIAADAAINDTFLRMCINSSHDIMTTVLSKLRSYIAGRIIEPTVAGGILASMCRNAVQSDPVRGLATFIPLLVQTLTARMKERPQQTDNKLDEELQFNLQLLGEVLGCTGYGVYRSKGEHILPWVEDICSVLDMTLHLTQKDEYELAHSALQALLTWLCRTRVLETGARVSDSANTWGQMVALDDIELTWYIPGEKELATVHDLLGRFLAPLLQTLTDFADGKISLDKDTLQRNLKLVLKIINAISELLEPDKVDEFKSVLSTNMSWLKEKNINISGDSVRKVVNNLMCKLQDKLIQDLSDDADSFTGIIYIYDVLLFSYGLDEDEIGDHIEDHKREKLHREDKLKRGKKHLPGVHLGRVSLHWETHVWLKNLLLMETLPLKVVGHLMTLCIHRYSEVRIAAQDLMLKIVARLGPTCHKLIIPHLVECLRQQPLDDSLEAVQLEDDVDNEDVVARLKGALYLIYSEKHMFFYSWESAAELWPALVSAQYCDKQSVDDLLKDISIKANRYYQDYVLYSLPLTAPVIHSWLVDLVKNNTNITKTAGVSLNSNNCMKQLVHYQELESSLISLLSANTLHWRHQEMAVGMLLTMISYDHTPSLATTQLWLSLLISDQRTLRLMAYQALEGILKLSKLPSNKVTLSALVPEYDTLPVSKPGVRPDNQCLQYKGAMTDAEIQSYWSQPFVVKSYVGYYNWPGKGHQDTARMTHSSDDFTLQPDSVRGLIAQFFLEESKMNAFVEFNSLEHEKGHDFFSTDRGLFLSFLLENIGPALTGVFQPHIERLVGSPEESQQRAAAEMVYGLVRGSRFWDWHSTSQLWSWLLPVFQQILNNVTSETQSDWDFCFSGASNKADPNRLRWLYELLITPENLVSQGSFKESSYLLFVSKCLSMNWRVQELYCRTFNILRDHWDHPYNNVRHQIAATLATLTNMDVPWAGPEAGNIGQGFPTKKLFIEEVTPMLSLNCPNPEFQSSRSLSPASLNTSHSSSEDVSMETVEDEETKRGKRILEMVSLWVCHTIRTSSSSFDPILYELLPYMCQFIGTECDQGVSQSCLQALSYLSVCIIPNHALAPCLHMLQRCITSSSYKTKLSTLEFLQTVVFTNFPSFVGNNEHRSKIINLTTSLLADSHIIVRQKAAKILGGLLHSGFVADEVLTELLATLRSKVRIKMTRQGRKKFMKDQNKVDNNSTAGATSSNDKLITLHSGILGLCAFVEAFPHDVPSFLPPILMELSTHLNDPQPVPTTIKKTLQEFKRTHQDNWQEHKTKFTEDQLYVMTDLLVSHNYYA